MAVPPAEQREMRRLGQMLAALRIDAGITQEQAAQGLEVNNRNRISYVERGKAWPRPHELPRLIKLYGGSKHDLRLAERIMLEGQSVSTVWWEPYREFMPGSLQQLVDYESVATEIRSTSALVFPGLLQARPYAQALFRDEREERGSRTMDALLEVRMGRAEEVFGRTPAVRLHAIFSEAALHCLVGGRDVMREQLDHIIELANRPNVTVQVLAFACGAPTQLVGAYTVHDYGSVRPATMHSDANDGLVFTENRSDVSRAKGRFQKLSDVALSPGASLKLTEEIGKGF
jgi:transcriptional regulator with XRE-family HTH domain